ncbi:LysR family transcriptional regulator [Zobellella denitrificans]|uniref:LysR family transcriptional regulator n=2 Tax=Zobellella denitrificans TaxID=347534 RepID=A0A231MWE1_9GAMM|nr:LysR family transcriptional regulator [Zobellella denitrificans]OXS14551.1 LysR family transcriptional regulator [Zobellella denitrificans]
MYRPFKTLPPLDSLLFFEAVARHGSFTRAAAELCLTQSAVSKQIKVLEGSLGLVLFERQPRGIALTRAGQALFGELPPLLQQLQRSVERLKAAHNSRSLTLVCTHAVAHYWLFPRLVEFSKVCPELAVHVNSTNDINEYSLDEHDLGILYGDGNWPSLRAELLFEERVYPIRSRDLALEEPAEVAQLRELPLIQLDSSAWNCLDWADWFRHFGVDYRPPANAPSFNQVTLAFNGVLQGMGVGLGWDFMAREQLEAGLLRRVGPFCYNTGRADYLVHNRHKPLSAAAGRFRHWLLENG